ncbi:MAG: hypothetical protein ACOZCL_08895 [Bacillota bacterium]
MKKISMIRIAKCIILLLVMSILASPSIFVKASDKIVAPEEIVTPPQQLQDIVNYQLAYFKGFENCRAMHYYPIYGPDRSTVLYYEAKITSDTTTHRGYIILSATEQDYPIVEFHTEGLTNYERLSRLLSVPFKAIRYGTGYIAAEDSEGNRLAAVGDEPLVITPEMSELFSLYGNYDSEQPELTANKDIKIEGDYIVLYENNQEIMRALNVNSPSVNSDPIVHYETLKVNYNKQFTCKNQLRVEAAWNEIRAAVCNAAAIEGSNAVVVVPGFDCYEIARIDNRTFFDQYAPFSGPNHDNYKSGCGPAAWINLMGWFDLNLCPTIFEYSPRTNSDFPLYTGGITMDLKEALGTYWSPGTDANGNHLGATWQWEMEDALDYIQSEMSHIVKPYSHIKYSVWPEFGNTEESIYRVVRDSIIYHKKPCIIGYLWHYDTALGVAEHRDEDGDYSDMSFVYIDHNGGKWIYADDLIGAWAVYDFVPKQQLLRDPGFEDRIVFDDPNIAIDINPHWNSNGATAWRYGLVDSGEQREGLNCFKMTSSGTGWNDIYQTVIVKPNTDYRLSVWLKSDASGSFGVRNKSSYTGATIIDKQDFSSTSGRWNGRSILFNSGNSTMITVYAGFTGTGQNKYLILDQLSLTEQ